jgi:plasmid stabilization system protein ParE
VRVIIRSDAEEDIAEGYTWYEKQQPGLGIQFVNELSATVDAIQDDPLRFAKTFRRLRRALVHRFPYGVFYIVSTDALVIVAVMHLARDPRRVHRRTR